MKNHITKYMRKFGDSVEPSYADLFDRIEALEGELERAKADRNAEGVRQRSKYLPKLTQYRVALERCVSVLRLCVESMEHPNLLLEEMRAIRSARESIAKSTPLIEKGRK